MLNSRQFLKYSLLTGASLLIISLTNQAQAQIFNNTPNMQANRYGQLPVAPTVQQMTPIQRNVLRQPVTSQPQSMTGRYGGALPSQSTVAKNYKQNFWEKLTGKNKHHYASYSNQLRGERVMQYQQRPAIPHPLDQFQRWSDYEPEYRLYPGDQVDVVVRSAPELSRTLTVGPDGRVVMPMTEPVMAAGQTLSVLRDSLHTQLATQLRDPQIDVTPRAYGPQQIYVGGEVGAQGTYTLPGPIGALEAILMAGGFRTTARSSQVVILRRAVNGGMMARTIDFKDGLHNALSLADNIQIKRGDIIFVPRSNIAEINLFMQNFRGALPFDLSLSYNLGETFNNDNDTVAPVVTPTTP